MMVTTDHVHPVILRFAKPLFPQDDVPKTLSEISEILGELDDSLEVTITGYRTSQEQGKKILEYGLWKFDPIGALNFYNSWVGMRTGSGEDVEARLQTTNALGNTYCEIVLQTNWHEARFQYIARGQAAQNSGLKH
jgi:hypothetical protein